MSCMKQLPEAKEMAKVARTMRTRMMNSPRLGINWQCKGTLCSLGGLLVWVSILSVLMPLLTSKRLAGGWRHSMVF